MRFKEETTFPDKVSETATAIVLNLDCNGYFNLQFNDAEEAKKTFYYRIAESLLPKFISGDEIELDDDECMRVLVNAAVEHSLSELEQEGRVYCFDDTIVLID